VSGLNIESVKGLGIGMWFVYVSYDAYVWVNGADITSFFIGSIVCTIAAVFVVACFVIGVYLMATGAGNLLMDE